MEERGNWTEKKISSSTEKREKKKYLYAKKMVGMKLRRSF